MYIYGYDWRTDLSGRHIERKISDGKIERKFWFE